MISASTTNLSGCGKGNGRSSMLSIIENMPVVAPIPRASIRTAAIEKPGDFNKWRTAVRRSRMSIGLPSEREGYCSQWQSPAQDTYCCYRWFPKPDFGFGGVMAVHEN